MFLRYQESPDLAAYTYHMIAASLLQSTKGQAQQDRHKDITHRIHKICVIQEDG